jgi:diacylglycerol kinase
LKMVKKVVVQLATKGTENEESSFDSLQLEMTISLWKEIWNVDDMGLFAFSILMMIVEIHNAGLENYIDPSEKDQTKCEAEQTSTVGAL